MHNRGTVLVSLLNSFGNVKFILVAPQKHPSAEVLTYYRGGFFLSRRNKISTCSRGWVGSWNWVHLPRVLMSTLIAPSFDSTPPLDFIQPYLMENATLTRIGLVDNSLFDKMIGELRVHVVVDYACTRGCSCADCFVSTYPILVM